MITKVSILCGGGGDDDGDGGADGDNEEQEDRKGSLFHMEKTRLSALTRATMWEFYSW